MPNLAYQLQALVWLHLALLMNGINYSMGEGVIVCARYKLAIATISVAPRH